MYSLVKIRKKLVDIDQKLTAIVKTPSQKTQPEFKTLSEYID